MLPAPMDFSVDLSCEMKVNRNCQLCDQKVTEIMHNLTAIYTVDFLGENNTMILKARGNPNIILAIIEKYGDHGKLIKFHMNGEAITPQPGGVYYGQSGYYFPTNVPANYPYTPSPYAPPPPQILSGNYRNPMPNHPPPPQQFISGNYRNPMPNHPPPPQTEAPREAYKQHTAPPSYGMKPPPPMPLSSYSYIEPPYWPTSSSSGGKCVIM